MNDFVNQNIGNKKSDLLTYYRNRAEEQISDIKQIFGETQYKQRASAINKAVIETRGNLIKTLEQRAKKEAWDNKKVLEGILMITYTSYIVMMESRNDVWPYEYMAFSRRIGELWEPFCLLTWEYPLNDSIEYFTPPLFTDVKKLLNKEIADFIATLNISQVQKDELLSYYKKVWTLVTSGEIKLELDLHFQDQAQKYNVDFKSGFSSNEKGNTNRLLLVASIYEIIQENYKCSIYVRSVEETNNHYLQTLKKSKLWNVFCGKETYEQIHTHTHFDLLEWIRSNVSWEDDFDSKMYKHLNNNNLLQYLEW